MVKLEFFDPSGTLDVVDYAITALVTFSVGLAAYDYEQRTNAITNLFAKSLECLREWLEAYNYCYGLQEQPNRPRGVWGGSVGQCVRGQVSERCGGNRVE